VARREPVPPVPTDGSASAASVLPGVALPDWAAPHVATPPPSTERESVAVSVAAPEPELVGAVVGATAATPTAPAPYVPEPPPAPPATAALDTAPVTAETVVLEPVVEPEAVPAAVAVAQPDVPTPRSATVLPGTAQPFLPQGADGQQVAPPAPSTGPVLGSMSSAPAGTSSRRPLLLVGLLVLLLAVGAFAAFVTPGFLAESEPPAQPAAVVPTTPTVTLPAKVAGMTQVTSKSATAAATVVSGKLVAAGLASTTAATYTAKGSPVTTLGAGPVAKAAQGTFLDSWAKAFTVSKPTSAKTGAAGVTGSCGTAKVNGKNGAACGFVGPQVAGSISAPGTTPKQLAKQLPAFVAAPSLD
jgi:hypothetical protein